jgi:hypothetical protein
LPSGEQVLTRVYYSYVEPIQIAWRKRPRMARVAIASLDGLAYGEIGLAPCSRHCIPVCAEIVEAHRVYLSKEGSACSKARRDHGEIPQSGGAKAHCCCRYPKIEGTDRIGRVRIPDLLRLATLRIRYVQDRPHPLV